VLLAEVASARAARVARTAVLFPSVVSSASVLMVFKCCTLFELMVTGNKSILLNYSRNVKTQHVYPAYDVLGDHGDLPKDNRK